MFPLLAISFSDMTVVDDFLVDAEMGTDRAERKRIGITEAEFMIFSAFQVNSTLVMETKSSQHSVP